MLVTSIFSFSNDVLKEFKFQGTLNLGSCGNGLKTLKENTMGKEYMADNDE